MPLPTTPPSGGFGALGGAVFAISILLTMRRQPPGPVGLLVESGATDAETALKPRTAGIVRPDELRSSIKKGVEPKGAEFLGLVVNQLMPRVERAFRVRTDAAGTAIGGSSLGAAMAILAVKIYPDRFGGILAESLPLGHAKWTAFVESVKVWPRRVYFGMGGREAGNESEKAKANEEQVAQTKQIEQRLSSAGLGADRKLFVIDAEAVHNEGAWKKRLPAALEFLFPPVK